MSIISFQNVETYLNIYYHENTMYLPSNISQLSFRKKMIALKNWLLWFAQQNQQP